MSQVFFELIRQLNSAVFVLIVILLAVGYLLLKIGEWKQKFFDHDNRVSKVENFSERVIAMETKIDLIYRFSNPNAPTKSQSPVSLTLIGNKIVQDINANEILKRYELKLIEMVEKERPNTAYDIQQVSFNVVKEKLIDLLDEKELIKVKEQAFSLGILIEDVTSVFGVLLRNIILEQRKIPIAEVDKHDPQKK
ncbi:MAG: hypothetical protein WCP97_06695 [bacterium]